MHGEMGAPSFVPWIAFYKRVIHVQIQKSKQAASQLIYLWPYLPYAKCNSVIKRSLKIYKFQANTHVSVREFLSLLLFRQYVCLFLSTDINL